MGHESLMICYILSHILDYNQYPNCGPLAIASVWLSRTFKYWSADCPLVHSCSFRDCLYKWFTGETYLSPMYWRLCDILTLTICSTKDWKEKSYTVIERLNSSNIAFKCLKWSILWHPKVFVICLKMRLCWFREAQVWFLALLGSSKLPVTLAPRISSGMYWHLHLYTYSQIVFIKN